ncbi:MAG: phage portal protein [Planctomycetota bacterium]
MAYRLSVFSNVGLDEALLKLVIDEHSAAALPRLDKLWTYYRNPLKPVGRGNPHSHSSPDSPTSRESSGWYTLGQEVGLPQRVTGRGSSPTDDDRQRTRREVVIENDIGWRIQTMIDLMFGKPVKIASIAKNEETKATIERTLDSVWEHSGGIALLQDAALLAHVFGHVDLMVSVDEQALKDAARAKMDPAQAAQHIRIEVIDPRRGIPLLDPADVRRITAYVVHFQRQLNSQVTETWWQRAIGAAPQSPTRATAASTLIVSGTTRQLYDDRRLTRQENLAWSGGELPIVHIQNLSQPLHYTGVGEVEPLIPLQDELNTRLSDRANRVALQCFKMYIAKGIEGFDQAPIGPGRIWSTDNLGASVEAFGGDMASPSEDNHIQQIRDALDKISSVPPLAGGVVQGRIGNLSSATALRVTLMSALAKTARKRVTYGRGLTEICRLVLTALDWAGALRTDPAERAVRINWPDPVPIDEHDRILAAEGKLRLGVPQSTLLEELGYTATDVGVV